VEAAFGWSNACGLLLEDLHAVSHPPIISSAACVAARATVA
jgi:hypothetical protein